MNYLKYIVIATVLVVAGISCSTDESQFPINTKELIDEENTGGFLRIIDIASDEFSRSDIPGSSFNIELEADDAQNGGQLESVDFYVAFTDNGDETRGDVEETADPILTVEASGFTVNEDSGLPRATMDIPASDALNALGLQPADLDTTDTFNFRWTLNLSNGKSFSVDNSGLNITGGAFFNSPFQTSVDIVE